MPRAVLRFAIREGRIQSWQPLPALASGVSCGLGRNRQIRRMCKSVGLTVEWLLSSSAKREALPLFLSLAPSL